MNATVPNKLVELATELRCVPTSLKNATTLLPVRPYQKRTSLPPDYVPTALDVCCGRGKKNWNHEGNTNFRSIIRSNVLRYMEAPTKSDKTRLVCSIVDMIRQQGGKFLKEDDGGMYYDIGDIQARDKVGHSLRDQVSSANKQKIPKKFVRRSSKVSFDDTEMEIEIEFQPLPLISSSMARDSFSQMASALPDLVPSFDDTVGRRLSARQFLDNLSNLDQCSDEESLDNFIPSNPDGDLMDELLQMVNGTAVI